MVGTRFVVVPRAPAHVLVGVSPLVWFFSLFRPSPASDVNDQAKGAVDFWAGLLDAAAAEVRERCGALFFPSQKKGGASHETFRSDCAALIPGQLPKLALKLAEACGVLWKYSSGKEIESCFLLLCSLVRSATPEERRSVALALAGSVAQQAGAEAALKTRILTTLYNFFPALRFGLLLEVIEQSKRTRDASAVEAHAGQLGAWCDEWKVTQEQRGQLFFACYELFASCNLQQQALAAIKSALRAAVAAESDEAQGRARTAVVLALSLPDEYVLDDLAAIPAVRALGGAAAPERALVYRLLQIVVEGSVADFEAFAAANGPLLEANRLRAADLLAKMRLLSLASAAAEKAVLPYSEAAAALGLPDNGAPLEAWIIRAISQGLISGKLDQLSRTVKISGAVSRTFGPKQWDKVASDIESWLAAVRRVSDLVNQANQAK